MYNILICKPVFWRGVTKTRAPTAMVQRPVWGCVRANNYSSLRVKSQKPYVMHHLVGKILVIVLDDGGELILNPNNDEFCQSLIYLFTF